MLTSPTIQPDVAVAHAVGVLDVFIAMGLHDFHELCQWQAERASTICGRAVDLDHRHVFLYEDGHVEVEPIDNLRPPGQLVMSGGLFMKVSETGYFDWDLEPHSKLGVLLENQRQDILARGVEAITLSGSDPVGGYNPTDAVMAAYFAELRYPHIDDRLLELEKSRIRQLIEDGEIAAAGKRLRDHLSGVETFPGVLKYLTQVTELRPLLDFWDELRVIQGGLL